MWAMITFLLESLIFMLVGLELPRVIVALRSNSLHQLLVLVLATTLACVVVRFAWVSISIQLPGVRRRLRGTERAPAGRSRSSSRGPACAARTRS